MTVLPPPDADDAPRGLEGFLNRLRRLDLDDHHAARQRLLPALSGGSLVAVFSTWNQ